MCCDHCLLARKHTGKVGPVKGRRSPANASSGHTPPKPKTSPSSTSDKADNETASSSSPVKSVGDGEVSHGGDDELTRSKEDESSSTEVSADSAANGGGEEGPKAEDKITPTSSTATEEETDKGVASKPKIHPFFGKLVLAHVMSFLTRSWP